MSVNIKSNGRYWPILFVTFVNFICVQNMPVHTKVNRQHKEVSVGVTRWLPPLDSSSLMF